MMLCRDQNQELELDHRLDLRLALDLVLVTLSRFQARLAQTHTITQGLVHG